MPFFPKASGILGMNARNLLFIQKYNSKESMKFADDKLYTKTFLQSRNIGVAKLYNTIKTYEDLEDLRFEDLPNQFVVKPNHGYGGDGILISLKKKNNFFYSSSGDEVSYEELYLHITSILDGKYSISGTKDQAIIEEYLEVHDDLRSLLTVEGLPDIRIIVFNYVPVIAMLRLPTKESEGKGNLQLGAIGLGIDIATGRLTYGYKNEQFTTSLPNGDKIEGRQIPEWDEILLTASKIQQSTNIGFVGVDLTLTTNGLKVLEVNARPGLKVQICNRVPLKERLELVKNYKVVNPEQGAKLAKQLFSQKVVTESSASKDLGTKPIIGLNEPITIYGDEVRTFFAKINLQSEENIINPNVGIPEGLLDISIQNRRLKLPFKYGEVGNDHDLVLSGKYLGGFLIDTTVKNEINTNQITDINYRMIINIDKKVAEIDEKVNFISYFRPLNLNEVKEMFLENKIFSPQFEYKETPKKLFEEIRKDLQKIPKNIDHVLFPLYQDKIKEIEMKIKLVESRNSEKMGVISEKMFGKVDYNLYKEAVSFIKKYKEEKDASKSLSPYEVNQRLQDFLDYKKLSHWRIKFIDNATSNMSVSKKGIIFVNNKIEVTENHLQALIAHEIETHVFRSENSKAQKYRIFERGTAKYLEIEEGLAIFNQQNTGVSLGDKEIWAHLRIVGAFMGKKMSFLELFLYLQDTFDVDDNVAWQTCFKVKRGLKDTGILTSFTKDTIYFTGLKKVEEFIRTASKEDIELLYSGKITIENLKTFREMEIIKPKYIPSKLLEFFENDHVKKNKRGDQ